MRKLFFILILLCLSFGTVVNANANELYIPQLTSYGSHISIFDNKIYSIQSNDIFINGEKHTDTGNILEFKIKNDGKIIYIIKENYKFYIQDGKSKKGYYDGIFNLELDKKGNHYYIAFNENKYFIVKNNKIISKKFNYIDSLIIGEENIYFLAQNENEFDLYKNGEIIFSANSFKNIHYNDVDNKLYFVFNKGNLKGISKDNNVIISNYINQKLTYIDGFYFNTSMKGLVYKYKEDTYEYLQGEYGEITKNETTDIFQKLSFLNSYKKINNDLNLNIFQQYGNVISSFSRTNRTISIDNEYIGLKSLWAKLNTNYKDQINIEFLSGLSKKITYKISTSKDKKLKKKLFYLNLIVSENIKNLEWRESYDKYLLELKEEKNNFIGFNYTPEFWKQDADGIKIKDVKKTYEQENNRYLLEVDFDIDKTIFEKDKNGQIPSASEYFWWKASDGYFGGYEEESQDTFQKVYFYPLKNKPLSDYQIDLGGGDNLGYADRTTFNISKDDFNYKEINTNNFTNNLEIISKNNILFTKNNIFSIVISAYEYDKLKKEKTAPTNISLYLAGVEGENIDEKILLTSKKIEDIHEYDRYYLNYFESAYDQEDISKYLGKKINLELEVMYENTNSAKTMEVIYYPGFTVDFRVRGGDNNNLILIDGKRLFPLGEELQYIVPVIHVEKDLLTTEDLENYQYDLSANIYTSKYHENIEHNIDLSLSYDTSYPYLFIYKKDKENIIFTSKIEEDFYDYFYNYYSEQTINIIDLKKGLEEEILKGGVNLYLNQSMYLKVLEKYNQGM